jgi:ArsR family transcriptional regulator
MKNFTRVMKSVSDPNRVRILKLLQEKELCVCEIQELLGLAQSTISKHLKLLDDAELISGRREGAWVIYALNLSPGSVYAKNILENIENWLNDDTVYLDLKKRLPFVNRLRITS